MNKANKDKLYRFYINHIDISLSNKNYFESAWLAYSLIEDRLTSMLIQTGGNKPTTKKQNKFSRKPIKMLGPKLDELSKRLKTHTLLKKELTTSLMTDLKKWKDDRNTLMHSMADGSMTVEEIQAKVEALATKGRDVAREAAATSRRLKKKSKRETLKLTVKGKGKR